MVQHSCYMYVGQRSLLPPSPDAPDSIAIWDNIVGICLGERQLTTVGPGLYCSLSIYSVLGLTGSGSSQPTVRELVRQIKKSKISKISNSYTCSMILKLVSGCGLCSSGSAPSCGPCTVQVAGGQTQQWSLLTLYVAMCTFVSLHNPNEMQTHCTTSHVAI